MPSQFLVASTALPYLMHQLYLHTNQVQGHFCLCSYLFLYLSYDLISFLLYVLWKNLKAGSIVLFIYIPHFLSSKNSVVVFVFMSNRFIHVFLVLILNRMDIHGT
jgi:hypothetical protein